MSAGDICGSYGTAEAVFVEEDADDEEEEEAARDCK